MAAPWHDRHVRRRDRRGTRDRARGADKWRAKVADHDYGAAEAYLSLKLDEETVHKTVKRLHKASLTKRRANDILRAAGLTAAPLDDPG